MKNIQNRIGYMVTGAVAVLYSVLMFFLFYRQSILYGGQYVSDMMPYILETQGIDSGYNFPYPLMFLLAKLFFFMFDPYISMALTVTLLNTLSLLLLNYYLKKYFRRRLEAEGKKWNLYGNLLITLLSLSLLFVSMVYAPRGHGFFGFAYLHRCNGVYTPNPLWNATYLATRPFSIVCFFTGITLLDSYEKKIDKKNYWIFLISLMLTTLTKPSYTFVAVSVFAVIMVYRFLIQKGKNVKQSIYFGLCFLPTGFVLIYQFLGIFTGVNSQGEETGIGFAIGKAWSLYTSNISLSIVMALAFPLGVMLINLPRLRDTTYFRHGWQILLAGFLMLLGLYEKGFRMGHTNFAWGYMHGLFFVFTVSVMMLLQNSISKKGRVRTVMVVAGWLGYLWHLICGIGYFIYVLAGNNSGQF